MFNLMIDRQTKQKACSADEKMSNPFFYQDHRETKNLIGMLLKVILVLKSNKKPYLSGYSNAVDRKDCLMINI